MFTGIVQGIGKIVNIEKKALDWRIGIQSALLESKVLQIGESIAINGTCLTVVDLMQQGFYADVSQETLSCTNFNVLTENSFVNLETSLTLQSLISGHLVTGHVDGIGKVIAIEEEGSSWRFTIVVPEPLAKYIAPKGSVTIDGTSLTVNAVENNTFGINIIPHTFSATIFQYYQIGSQVNMEVDLIARYVERLIHYRQS